MLCQQQVRISRFNSHLCQGHFTPIFSVGKHGIKAIKPVEDACMCCAQLQPCLCEQGVHKSLHRKDSIGKHCLKYHQAKMFYELGKELVIK